MRGMSSILTAGALGVMMLAAYSADATTPEPREMEETFHSIALKCLANALLAHEQGHGSLPMSTELCPLGGRKVIEVPGHGAAITLMRAGDQVGVITKSGTLLWAVSPETQDLSLDESEGSTEGFVKIPSSPTRVTVE